jgi:hypothetical protein
LMYVTLLMVVTKSVNSLPAIGPSSLSAVIEPDCEQSMRSDTVT